VVFAKVVPIRRADITIAVIVVVPGSPRARPAAIADEDADP